jgi:hypothetical protein
LSRRERARLLADESLRGPVVRGLRRHHPDVDLVVAASAGLESWPDPNVLAWAADHGRVVVAQDVKTMIRFAGERMNAGLAFPGLILVPEKLRVAVVLQDIATLVERSIDEPLDDRWVHLPLDKAWRVSEDEPSRALVET